MEWFREILELITSPDVGPAEHQGKRNQFTAISETSPDLRLFPDFVIFVILYIKINIACSRRCGFMKSNSLRHEIQFPQRHISNLIQLTVHLSMFPIFNVTQVFQFTNMSSYQKGFKFTDIWRKNCKHHFVTRYFCFSAVSSKLLELKVHSSQLSKFPTR